MKTNEVLENIKARRSVRAYTDRQVSEEDCTHLGKLQFHHLYFFNQFILSSE